MRRFGWEIKPGQSLLLAKFSLGWKKSTLRGCRVEDYAAQKKETWKGLQFITISLSRCLAVDMCQKFGIFINSFMFYLLLAIEIEKCEKEWKENDNKSDFQCKLQLEMRGWFYEWIFKSKLIIFETFVNFNLWIKIVWQKWCLTWLKHRPRKTLKIWRSEIKHLKSFHRRVSKMCDSNAISYPFRLPCRFIFRRYSTIEPPREHFRRQLRAQLVGRWRLADASETETKVATKPNIFHQRTDR